MNDQSPTPTPTPTQAAPTLYLGESCKLLTAMPDLQADLVYIDGPFLTGDNFKTSTGELAFTDRFRCKSDYYRSVLKVLLSSYEHLKPGGNLVLHVDQKTEHHWRQLLDAALGEHNFTSSIVWHYRRWPSNNPNFQKMHDTLLRYSKPGAPPIFNKLYQAPTEATQKGTKGKRMEAYTDPTTGKRRNRITDEDSLGPVLNDVWVLPIVAPGSKERKRASGYPTVKPEALMERLVLSLSTDGGLVIDPMCGSGSMLVAATKHNRRSLGIDASEVAIAATETRLNITGKDHHQ